MEEDDEEDVEVISQRFSIDSDDEYNNENTMWSCQVSSGKGYSIVVFISQYLDCLGVFIT